jgi:hypothetical protein
MASTTPLQDSTSDLCTELLDAVRDLRSACSRSAHFLSESPTNKLTNAPFLLRSITARLRALDKPLVLLRNEIESPLPLEDLHELSKSAEESIYQLQLVLQPSGRRTLGRDLLLEVAEDLYHIYERAIRLRQACTILDNDLCPVSHRWTDGDTPSENTPSDLESSMRLALHTQLVAKLESEGRQCPICLEDMVDGTDNQPTITKCGHVFCEECIETVVEEQQKCPMCRRGIRHTGFLFK